MKSFKPLPYIAFVTLMTIFTFESFGQKIERHVLSSSGEFLTSDAYTLLFTLGESYSQTLNDGGQLNQGFEQEWAVVTAIDEPEADGLDVKVYPNLTPGILNVEVQESVEANLFDLNGHQLKNWSIESGKISVQIDELPSGLYVIVFKSKDGNKVSSVKVNKFRS